MAAGLEPGFQLSALLGTRVRTGDVGDEQLAHGQPFLHVGEVVGDGSRNLSLGQQREEPKAGIVVVVTGAGAGRKAAGNDMSAVVDDVGHVMPLSRSMPDAIGERAAASITPSARSIARSFDVYRAVVAGRCMATPLALDNFPCSPCPSCRVAPRPPCPLGEERSPEDP